MKIAYLTGQRIPSDVAGSIHSMKMGQALVRNEHDVVLMAPDYPLSKEEEAADPFSFYGVEPCFRLKKKPWLNVKGGSHLFGISAALSAKRLRPDLVYSRSLHACFYSALLGLPTVFDAHVALGKGGGRVSAMVLAFFFRSRFFKRLVVNSEALQEIYTEQFGIRPERVQVTYNGADESKPTEKLPFARNERLQVGYVGALYPGKGMEMVAALSERCSWADFHAVGGSESDLRSWKKKLGGASNVSLHGFVPPSETDRYRESFDVLLAPYQRKVTTKAEAKAQDEARWVCPIKLFEYMAAGKPIICSDWPVARQVLEEGRNGLLRASDDPAAWEEALTRLRDNPGLRERLGKEARKDFTSKYTWKKRAERVLAGLPL